MFIAIIRMIVWYGVRAFQLLLFLRAILSWFPMVQIGRLNEFLYYATEPLLSPVRRFLQRFEVLRSLPIDFSVLIVFILLEVVSDFIL